MAMQQIRGLDDALKTLQQIDPVLKREATKGLKDDVKPIVTAIKAGLPQVPLSNWIAPKQSSARRGRVEAGRSGAQGLPYWQYGKAKGGVRASVKKQSKRGMKGKQILVSVRSTNGAAEAFDMAGKTTPGNRLARSLDIKGYGDPSRLMWPTAEKHKPQVVASIERSIVNMSTIINQELKLRGYTRGRPAGSPHFR
jgi:hypothetical protein